MAASSGERRWRARRVLGTGLATATLLGAVGYLAFRPTEVELAQTTEEPPSDECGTRPLRPTATTVESPPTSLPEPEPTATDPTATTVAGETTTTSVAEEGSVTSFETTSTTTGTSSTTAPPQDPHWRCTLVEEFEGTALDRGRWFVQTTTEGNFGVGGECFVDDPDNIAVSDGTLKLTVRQEPEPIPCPRAGNPGFSTPVTAGSIITRPSLDQTYGRYEIRARMPDAEAPGLHFAFWLWPRDLTNYPVQFGDGDADKWSNGELDVLEWYSRYPYHQVPYIHYAHTYVQAPNGRWVPDDPNITAACLVGRMSEWHTYALEWTPTSIRMLYDGRVCLENTRWTPRNTTMPGPFDKPFMVSLTQALGAIGTDNQAGSYTPLPATAEIDYLKIWQ